MNYRVFTKWCLLLAFAVSSIESICQTQFTYDFNKGLLPMERGGIALTSLGKTGQFVKEVVPGTGANGIPEIIRTVYRFEKNSGLQFNNRLANNFLSKSYTVEMYFKMDTLESWKRVLDFKNRKSDFGSYIYRGKLNFYNYAMSEKAPVKAGQYIHYVFSRDFETKMIKMYINGQPKVEFKDPGIEAVLDQDQVLNFFQDDLIANHESSSGSVVLIRVYDRVMTPTFIRRSYHSIIKISPQPAEEIEEVPAEEPVVVAPNQPVTTEKLVTVTGKVYDGINLSPAQAEILVKKTATDSIVAKTTTENGTYTVHLQPEQNYQVIVEALGFNPRVIPLKTSKTSQDAKTLVRLTRENFELPLTDIFFAQGNEELDGNAKAALDSMANYFIKRSDLKVILKGHTDNLGNFEKNIALSAQRVAAVKNYLETKGLPPDRVAGSGYGSARPNKFNQSEAQRQRNRRVEIWAEPIKR